MKLLEIQPGAAGHQHLEAELAGIDAVFCGAELSSGAAGGECEEREGFLASAIKSSGTNIYTVRIGSKRVDGVGDAKDRFRIIRVSDGSSEFPSWHQLANWFRKYWSGKHLLLDLTTLSGSSLFQLYAAATKAACTRVSFCYTTPERYPQVDRPDDVPPLVTRSIKQPHGYRCFVGDQSDEFRQHIIVLGFDRHRPNKFIEHYQWPTEEVHAIWGVPAYVQGGEEQARLSLGPIFNELTRIDHVHKVDPKLLVSEGSAPGVVDVLQGLTYNGGAVDLVPLGPKPTLLACLIFWHKLSEERKEHTRFLFDFPVTRHVRTEGVGVTWLYRDVIDCARGAVRS